LLVALVRLKGIEFNDNKGAARVTREHPCVKEAVAAIAGRVEQIDKSRKPLVVEQLNALLDDWLKPGTGQAATRVLGYRGEKDGVTQGLLLKPDLDVWQPFTVLNSLRDVEPTVGLILDEGAVGTPPDWSFATAGNVGADDAEFDDVGAIDAGAETVANRGEPEEESP
jgi:hypothetical protein